MELITVYKTLCTFPPEVFITMSIWEVFNLLDCTVIQIWKILLFLTFWLYLYGSNDQRPINKATKFMYNQIN